MNENYLVLFVIYFIIFVGSFVSSATGFGAGIIRTPFLLMFLPVKLVSPLINLVSLFDYAFTFMIDKKLRESILWSKIFILLIGNVFGAFLGSYLLKTGYNDIIYKILGMIIILWEIRHIASMINKQKSSIIKIKKNTALELVAGGLSGLGSAMFAVGGPPLIIYLQEVYKNNKKIMRSITTGFFAINSIIQVSVFFTNGLLTLDIILYSLYCFPVLILGSYLGKKLFYIFTNDIYQYLIAFILIFAGIVLIFR